MPAAPKNEDDENATEQANIKCQRGFARCKTRNEKAVAFEAFYGGFGGLCSCSLPHPTNETRLVSMMIPTR
eukprot:scaffold34646_cov173-Amphora_coffeaeformis.AAC.32